MKPMTSLPPDAAEVLKNRDLANIYRCDDDTARTLFHAGPTAGFNVYRIDLGRARKAEDVHRIFGKALHFPEWYGANWDALADCLTDMSWNEADGYLIILQSFSALISNDPAALETLIGLLRDTSEAWKKQRVSFWVLFIGDELSLPGIGVPS
jgi:hypothetical protein